MSKPVYYGEMEHGVIGQNPLKVYVDEQGYLVNAEDSEDRLEWTTARKNSFCRSHDKHTYWGEIEDFDETY